MKRTLFFIVLIVMMFGLSAQNYMLIYKTDGSIVVCGTAEIDSLKFVPMGNFEEPTVTTNEVENITFTSAICGGNVTYDGGVEVTAKGICWSTEPNPTVSDNYTVDGSGIGSYTSNLSNLLESTTYYVRAYATNVVGTSYGEEKSFTTMKEKKLSVVTTKDVEEITTEAAVGGGEVTDDGNCEVTARGVCWSTNQNPTIEDNKTTDGAGLGSYTSNLTNLESNTTYYVRAYATNEAGTAYGSIYVFETEEESDTPDYNGYEYVDLGLPSGLKWATCNVGATKPEEYGNYYAWGETATKSEYADSTSLTFGLSISQLQTQGYIDSEGNLTSQYDAATANWGGKWRMPTKAEMQELIDKCNWKWTTQNGVNGYKVTGPNGNSIFLPAAGSRSGSSLNYPGENGYYWSSTPYGSGSDGAYSLNFDSIEPYVYNYRRTVGRSVRPVSE